MTDSAADQAGVTREEARHLEERFLAAVAANASRLSAIPPRPGAQGVPAGRLRRRTVALDRSDDVRRVMAAQGIYDRSVLEAMPGDRAEVIEFWRRRLGRHRVVTLAAFVVNPMEALAGEGRAGRPASLAQATDRLREILPQDGTFHYVAAFSPTGWEGAALDNIPRGEDYELYLVERGPGTQWIVHGAGGMRGVFDPESEAEQLARCRAFIRGRRGQTMVSGLAAAEVAAAMRVERSVAERALGEAVRDDEHLALQPIGGEVRLVHTDGSTALASGRASAGPTGRSKTMGLWASLRERLHLRRRRRAPDPRELVRPLEERRARLQVQRDELDQRIEDLEKTNAELGGELKAEASRTRQEGLAQKIANVRRRVRQMQRRVGLFDKAIGVLNTHIDNLTIASEAREFELPTEDEMKTISVEVDGLVEAIDEKSDLAVGLDTAAALDRTSPEVEAILAEFGVAEPRVKAPPEGGRVAAPERQARAEPAAPEPQPPKREKTPPAAEE